MKMANRFTRILPKCSNANDGRKAHNDNKYYIVGRISYNSKEHKASMPVGDIVIFDRDLVHIAERRKEYLEGLSISAWDYISLIICNYDEIRLDNKGGYFFIKSGKRSGKRDIDKCAVVEFKEEYWGFDRVYVIKTARPMEWGRLKEYDIVC